MTTCPDCDQHHATAGEAFDCDVAHGRLAGTVIVGSRHQRRTIDVLGDDWRHKLGYPTEADRG